MVEKLKNNSTGMLFKSLALKVEDLDEGSRKVKVALSAFNIVDSDKDMIIKGAFTKSITENGPGTSDRNIAFLRNHDWDWQVGKWLELFETTDHLIGVGQLGRSTKGNDALLDYQDGIIREHSIGYNYIGDKIEKVGEGEKAFYKLKEVKLWEGSPVTFGANEFTGVYNVAKGLDKDTIQKEIDKLDEQMSIIVKVLTSGKGTDERFHELEARLRVVQQRYKSLILAIEPGKSTLKNEPTAEEAAAAIQEEAAQKFMLNLITKK